MKLFSLAIILSTLVLNAGEEPKKEFADPVILENSYLKLTIDRGRGATVRSLIDKRNKAEVVREFITGGAWCGGLAEDRFADSGYPGELTKMPYRGEIKRCGEMQLLELHGLPGGESKYKGLELIKIFKLPDSSSFFEVEWRIVNRLQAQFIVTPWVHNIVNSQYGNTVLPKRAGIALIPPSADYFQDPIRNWFGAYQPENGHFVYFCSDFKQILKQYYCYWNGFHSLEWTFQPVALTPGEIWKGNYYIGIAESTNVPAAVLPECVASWKRINEFIEIELSATVDAGAIMISAYGEVFNPFVADLKVGSPIKIKVPGNIDSLNLMLKKNNSYYPAKRFEQYGNNLSLDFRGNSAVTSPPALWQPPASAYKKITSQERKVKIIRERGSLLVAETDPLEKIFEQDTIVSKENYKRDFRVLRNDRLAWQLILRNKGDKPLIVTPESIILRTPDGKNKLPVSINEIGYIKTKEPSNFNLNYPIGRYPDPLLPIDKSLSIAPQSNIPLWLEVFVPAEQPAGRYTGCAKLTTDNGEIQVPLECEVLPIVLPVRSSLRTTAGCWGLSTGLLKEVGYSGTSKDFHEKCLELYYAHRLTPRENGINWTLDVAMDKQLAELKQHNPVSIAVPEYIVRDSGLLDKAIAMLKKNNLFEQAFFYTIDEAPAHRFPEVIEISKNLHSRHPDFKILGVIYETDVRSLYGHINIWCRGGIRPEPWIPGRRKLGDEFMSSNLQGLNIEDALAAPIVEFIKMKQCNFSGFLFWNMIGGYGKDNPWKDISCAGLNGNAHLLYPHSSGPVMTMRWKAMAAGIELFDLISMLECQNPEMAKRLIAKMELVADVDNVTRIRTQILDLLNNTR